MTSFVLTGMGAIDTSRAGSREVIWRYLEAAHFLAR